MRRGRSEPESPVCLKKMALMDFYSMDHTDPYLSTSSIFAIMNWKTGMASLYLFSVSTSRSSLPDQKE